eukprot:snap_masked-scaffold_2-processed-gene-3.4-mRNA-1 protein AED:1.00 eAED:1.00 QI:0/0/0/0/1/1/5/0/620
MIFVSSVDTKVHALLWTPEDPKPHLMFWTKGNSDQPLPGQISSMGSKDKFLVYGDIRGNIHCARFVVDEEEALQNTLWNVHGKDKVTTVVFHSRRIYSGGHNGAVVEYMLSQKNHLRVLRMSIASISKVFFVRNQLLVAGFLNEQYKIHNLFRNKDVFNYRTGGWRRPSAMCLDFSGETDSFVAFSPSTRTFSGGKKCSVCIARFKVNTIVTTDSFGHSFHGRTIWCVHFLNENWFVSGCEEGRLYLVKIGRIQNAFEECHLIGIQQTSVRTLCSLKMELESKEDHERYLIAASGGMKYITLWEVVLKPDDFEIMKIAECAPVDGSLMQRVLCSELETLDHITYLSIGDSDGVLSIFQVKQNTLFQESTPIVNSTIKQEVPSSKKGQKKLNLKIARAQKKQGNEDKNLVKTLIGKHKMLKSLSHSLVLLVEKSVRPSPCLSLAVYNFSKSSFCTLLGCSDGFVTLVKLEVQEEENKVEILYSVQVLSMGVNCLSLSIEQNTMQTVYVGCGGDGQDLAVLRLNHSFADLKVDILPKCQVETASIRGIIFTENYILTIGLCRTLRVFRFNAHTFSYEEVYKQVFALEEITSLALRHSTPETLDFAVAGAGLILGFIDLNSLV